MAMPGTFPTSRARPDPRAVTTGQRNAALLRPKPQPMPVQPPVTPTPAAPTAPTAPVTPSATPLPVNAQVTTTAPVTPPMPIAPITTGNGTVQGTPTNPATPLTTQTLSVAPTVDRFKIAEDRYNAGEGAYEAALRSAQRRAFGAGRGVSGQLRTSLGDATQAREAQRLGYLSDALEGTIGDAYQNVGIAQQQQGFQAGQQDSAFAKEMAQKQLQESLTSGAFGRALAQLQAGNAGSPDQIALILSQMFGGQAGQAGQAAGNLFNERGRGATPDWLRVLLEQINRPSAPSGGGGAAPVDDGIDYSP